MKTDRRTKHIAVSLLLVLLLLLGCGCTQEAAAQHAAEKQQTALPENATQSSTQTASLPDAPTKQQAQQLLDALGYAVLADFSQADEIPLSMLFYGNYEDRLRSRETDLEALLEHPAAVDVFTRFGSDASEEAILLNSTYFRRYDTSALEQRLMQLTGETATQAQLDAMLLDTRFPWCAVDEENRYAIDERFDVPRPTVIRIERIENDLYSVEYTLSHLSANHTTYYSGVTWQDGQYLRDGTLTLSVRGEHVYLVSNHPRPDAAAASCLASVTEGFTEQLSDEQTAALLQAMNENRLNVFLTQSFSEPGLLDLQLLLQGGMLDVSPDANEIRDALQKEKGGTFDAHTKSQIEETFALLTGCEISQGQWLDVVHWKYEPQWDVYCGYLTDAPGLVLDGRAYQMADGRVIVSYLQQTGTSVSGLCTLRQTQDGWQIQMNIRF